MPNNITELEDISPDMSLVELAKRTQASLDTLNHLLEQNPNLRVADILTPDPNSHEAEVRGVMFDVFHRAAKAMGRNSNEAILADARVLLENMAVNNLDMSEIQTSKGKKDSDIGKWISLVLIPMIQDLDIRGLIAPTKGEEGRYILQNIKPYQALGGKLYKRLGKYHTPK